MEALAKTLLQKEKVYRPPVISVGTLVLGGEPEKYFKRPAPLKQRKVRFDPLIPPIGLIRISPLFPGQSEVKVRMPPLGGSLLLNPVTLGQTEFEYRHSLLDRINHRLEKGEVERARQIIESEIASGQGDERLLKLSLVLRPGYVQTKDTRGPERRSEMAWIETNAQNYQGKWVAVLGDTLLAAGDDLKTVMSSLRKQKLRVPPLIHRIS